MRGIFEVNLKNFADNVRKIRAFLPKEVSYFSVVKADAYGFGIREIVRFIDKELSSSIQGFAVANVWEANHVRETGSQLPIIILGPMLPGELSQLRESGAIPMISSCQEVDQLEDYAAERNIMQDIHVMLDTGLGRDGVWYTELSTFLKYARSRGKHLKITGWATHYSSLDSDSQQAAEQLDRFLSMIPNEMGNIVMLHASSSFGIEKFVHGTNAVRIGVLQYGYPENSPLVKKLKLSPVGSLKGFVVLIKSLPSGTRVGYDGTYQLKHDTRTALLSIGYADGISKTLSGYVLIRGRRCPIIGLISMDVVTVDITDLPEVAIGDEAIFWGTQGDQSITLDEFARFSGWNYRSCTCYFSERIDRKYIE